LLSCVPDALSQRQDFYHSLTISQKQRFLTSILVKHTPWS
jgi:hypothetical protein